MNAKTTIRKILFIGVWILIGGGMLTLLLAAISRKNKGTCQQYVITIGGEKENFFIDNKDVEKLLMKATGSNIKGMPVSSFKLHELEEMLEHNTWINEAELYFDNRDVLHISVTEKTPVARLFTTNGHSFYIDSAGQTIPLSDKLSARVTVITSVPAKKKMNVRDSAFAAEITSVANFVSSHPFWSAQVAQIDITPDRTFEMIPVVGNHLVRLGKGDNIESKFNRVMIFYKEVLRHTGFEKYKMIDVQYEGQVVASRFAGNPKVDSIQLKRNVEKLLQLSLEAEKDTVIKTLPVLETLEKDDDVLPSTAVDQSVEAEPKKHIAGDKPVYVKPTAVVKRTETIKKKIEKKEVKKEKPAEKKPKAVMPPKVIEEENGGYY